MVGAEADPVAAETRALVLAQPPHLIEDGATLQNAKVLDQLKGKAARDA